MKFLLVFLFVFQVAWMEISIAQNQTKEWPMIVRSQDGTPISYEVYGTNEPTLLFVHGWSCDARYWRMQVSHFSKQHRVVLVDLAGHGHSGMMRTLYTMESFGQDVQAVIRAINPQSLILIGHSMGGAVIVEAGKLTPNCIIGLIGVDTLENVEYPMKQEELEKLLEPLGKDFPNASRQFVGDMISSQTPPELREWILSDMSSAPSFVALSAIREMMGQYVTGESARIFEKVRLPVVTINADMWPIDYDANRRHMISYQAIIIKGADHFLMMNRSEEFNQALEKAIEMMLGKKVEHD